MSNATEQDTPSVADRTNHHEGEANDGLTLNQALAASDLLQNWLPKLSQYQSALNQYALIESELNNVEGELPTKHIEQPEQLSVSSLQVTDLTSKVGLQDETEDATQSATQSVTQSVTQPVTQQVTQPATQPATSDGQLLHLPIDGVLGSIRKRTPYLLGIGLCGGITEMARRELSAEIVHRLAEKLNRRALLVRVLFELANDASATDTARAVRESSAQVETWNWRAFEDSKERKALWNSQLAKLVQKKSDFQLLVFDLGDASSDSMHRMGRLCDGVIVVIQSQSESRKDIQSIKQLHEDQLKLLGVWSM